MGEKIGKAKEVLGYATGDRTVEARGKVEERIADPDAPVDEETPETVDHERHDIRQARGEYQPDRH